MELKDFGTLGVSLVALAVAARAMWISHAGYKLAAARDQRERDAKLPLVRTAIEPIEQPHLFRMTFKVRNRDDVPIIIKKIYCEEGNLLTISSSARFQMIYMDMENGFKINPTWVMPDDEVAPGAEIEIEVNLATHKGPIGADTSIVMTIFYVRSDTEETTQSLEIRRMVFAR